MSEAGRRALWDREKSAPQAVPRKRALVTPKKATPRWPAQVPQQPKPKARRGLWRVVKVNDDGRQQDFTSGLAFEDAERIAGERRDRSTDAELLEGWNYLPMKQAMPKGGAHTLPFEARKL